LSVNRDKVDVRNNLLSRNSSKQSFVEERQSHRTKSVAEMKFEEKELTRIKEYETSHSKSASKGFYDTED